MKKTKRNVKAIRLLVPFILSLGAGVLLYFVLNNFLYAGVAAFLLLLFGVILFNKKPNKEKEEQALRKEFVNLFGFLEVYLSNRIPPYTALQRLIPFASESMGKRINDLIEGIDEDKSVAPYVRFASSFSSFAIKEVMISVYLIGEMGFESEYLAQFHLLFASFSEQEKRDQMDKKGKRLGNLQFFPLVGSALTMLMVTVGIMGAIGGIIGG